MFFCLFISLFIIVCILGPYYLLADQAAGDLPEEVCSLRIHESQERRSRDRFVTRLLSCSPVLRIRDILARIRILRSVHRTNESGRSKTIRIRIRLRIRLRNTVTFTSFFKDKKSINKSQNDRNQGFSYYFLLDDGRIRSRIRTCE